jgi:PAS domain S-box-containing protein
VLFKNAPIRKKLMIAMLLTSGAVLLLTCAAFITYEIVTLRKGMVEGYNTRAEIIAANSTAALAFQNDADAADVLCALKTDPRVETACIYDLQGKVFAVYPAHEPINLFPEGVTESGYRHGHLEIFCPIVQDGRPLGTVYIQSDLSALTERYWAYALLAAGIVVVSLLAAYPLARILQKQISLPVLALAETAKSISKYRDLSVRAKKFGEDELGLLTDAFNQMLSETQAQDEAIKKLNAGLEQRIAERTAELELTGQKLRENRELLDSVLNNIKDGIVAVDEKGQYFVFNPAAEKIMGRTPEGFQRGQRMKHFNIFRMDGVTPFPENEGSLEKAIRGEETNDVEMIIKNSLHPDGVLVVTSGRPLLDEKGNILGGVSIFRDITEQKHQENLKIYAKALEASNRDLQDFIFVASHDLQEPLRKIQSYGNFLKDEAKESLTGDSAIYLSRIQGAARRMSILIEDLLQLTRITTKAKPFERVDLSEIVREIQTDLEIRLTETGGKIEVGDLPQVEADPAQMRQLFQNLISNSLKYAKKGVPPVIRVESITDTSDGRCRVWVKDNGIGFEQQYAEKIFNIFQRLHANDEYEGTGIGLAICRKVVERHGGKITASSELGQGAIFEVVLPLHQIKN